MSGWMRTPLTGRHVLYVLLGMFAVVVLANGVFIYFALSSHPGVIDEDPYRKGLAYNDTLDEAASQKALGWRAALRFESAGGRAGVLELRLEDGGGQAVTGFDVHARLRRPANREYDRTLTLSEGAPGRYRARTALPLSGNWDVSLRAERDGRVFRLEKRLWVN